MVLRKYWMPLSVFVLAIAGICLYMLTTQTSKEPITIIKPVEVEKPTAEETPEVGDTSQGGHFHEDSTFHAEPHEPSEVLEPDAVESAQRSTPFANFRPNPNDHPVETAYKRLDYIANNLHEWGQFSPRTLELIDEMTPMPPPPKVEGDEVGTINSLDELSALRDPRSAEILIKYQMESGVMGAPLMMR